MIQITTNPNKETVAEIRAKIRENQGHCACAITFDDSNMCICKDFRDQIAREESGECHCGLYKLTVTDD